MGLVMPPGFHSAARWLGLCCEGIQKLISRGGIARVRGTVQSDGGNTVANCGYYFCDLFIKIECIQLFFDVSMVMV